MLNVRDHSQEEIVSREGKCMRLPWGGELERERKR
jgi:hypothetical protein